MMKVHEVPLKSHLSKVKLRRDIDYKAMEYFFVNISEIGCFCLLPKIHKLLYNVTGVTVISKCGYFSTFIFNR